jgi:hypothetical protein
VLYNPSQSQSYLESTVFAFRTMGVDKSATQ